MEKIYKCDCCDPPKCYSRSDVLFKHRRKYDPYFDEYKNILDAEKERYYADPRICLADGCDVHIEFKYRNKYKFCSHSCAATSNNRIRSLNNNCSKKQREISKITPLRFCEICNSELQGKQRKFCGLECLKQHIKLNALALREAKATRWRDGDNSVSTLANGELAEWARDFLISESDHKCSECGWSESNKTTGRIPLQIDHIDGYYKNNDLTNLRVLCPNCHSLTSTFGSLNNGRGRSYRIDRMNREFIE